MGYTLVMIEIRRSTTLPWDPAEHLATQEDRANYLEAAIEDGDLDLISAALVDIAKAKTKAG